MVTRRVRSLILGSLVCVLAALPVATLAHSVTQEEQVITIRDSRTGTGPCGFAIQRDIEGTVAVTPSIDDAGNLMLALAPVDLHGTLANPANGKSVDLRWIRQNGKAHFEADGETTAVGLALTGHFVRGYDNARTDLGMDLPADSAEILAFEAGGRAKDPWTHICGLLA
jgi:hypothetical protein